MATIRDIEQNYGSVSDENKEESNREEELMRRNIKLTVGKLISKNPNSLLKNNPKSFSNQDLDIFKISVPMIFSSIEEPEKRVTGETPEEVIIKKSRSEFPIRTSSARPMIEKKQEEKKEANRHIAPHLKTLEQKSSTPTRQAKRSQTPEKQVERRSLNLYHQSVGYGLVAPGVSTKVKRNYMEGKKIDSNLYTIKEDGTINDKKEVKKNSFLIEKTKKSRVSTVSRQDSIPRVDSSGALRHKEYSITDSTGSLSRDLKIKSRKLADQKIESNSSTDVVIKTPNNKLKVKHENRVGGRDSSSKGNLGRAWERERSAKNNNRNSTIAIAIKKHQEIKDQIAKEATEKPKKTISINPNRPVSNHIPKKKTYKLEGEEESIPTAPLPMKKNTSGSTASSEFQIKSFRMVLPKSPAGRKIEVNLQKSRETTHHNSVTQSNIVNPKQKEVGVSSNSREHNPTSQLVKAGVFSQSREKGGFQSLKEQGSILKRPQSSQVLPRSQKNEQQPESVIRIESGKKYSFAHSLLNLMYGIYMKTKSAQPGNSGFVARFNVVEGNNGRLVEGFLRQRHGTTHENMHQKSNIQWSQSFGKKLVVSSLRFLPRILYKELHGREEFNGLDINNSEEIASAIVESRLFRVSSLKILQSALGPVSKSPYINSMMAEALNMCNHLKGISCIAHKTRLTMTIIRYAKLKKIDPFSIIPKTFLLRILNFDRDFERFLQEKKKDDGFKNPVIVKPGENSNRGNGICMAYSPEEAAAQAMHILRDRRNTSCAILQYYITNPLLYQRRKFDIRCFGLAVKFSGTIFFYWYLDGYARTSSFEFNVSNKNNLMVHLTNEAVQVKGRLALMQISSILGTSSLETKSTLTPLTSTSKQTRISWRKAWVLPKTSCPSSK